jgi:hypothetical protein
MLRISRCGAGALMNLAPNDPGWMGVIVSVPYKRGRRSVPVSVAKVHLRSGLAYVAGLLWAALRLGF